MGQGAMLDFILIKGQKPFHDERKYYLASAGIHRNKLIFWRMTASSAAVSCFSILRENKDPMKNIKAGIPTSKSSHDTLQGLLTHGLVLISNSVKKKYRKGDITSNISKTFDCCICRGHRRRMVTRRFSSTG